MSKLVKHKAICTKLGEIYVAKNHDYNDSFSATFTEFGLAMPAIRLDDKLRRFKQLSKNKALVKDESILDTLYDMANYAILTIMELEK